MTQVGASVKVAKLPLPNAVKFESTTLSMEVSPAKMETLGAVTVAVPRGFVFVKTTVLGVPASSTTGIAASVFDTTTFLVWLFSVSELAGAAA